MIKYNLKCENGHEFESWFSNSHEFDKLNNKNLLECIFCSSHKIEKSKIEGEDLLDKKAIEQKNSLLKLREHVEKNFEFVGDKFSKKVREVYYDRKTKKSIYGTTTPEEREELADEGIDLLSIPWVNKDN